MAQLEFRRSLRRLVERVDRQAADQAGLMRQLNQAKARKRSYEDKFRRLHHQTRVAGKAVINLVDQAGAAAGSLQKQTIKSIRSLAQLLIESGS
jgi:hypothetical protein